jgi:osmotically-inducible protein OsmY
LNQRNDADIARAADNVLQWMPFALTNPIKVLVENGWITLSGNIDWEHQRQTALSAVRHLMGVKGVSDSFVLNKNQAHRGRPVPVSDLTPTVGDADESNTPAGTVNKNAQTTTKLDPSLLELSSSAVKKEIEAALLRRARTDGQNISVEVDGGVVTLRGTVHTWSERELARQSAWGTPGVMHVQDNLTLFSS